MYIIFRLREQEFRNEIPEISVRDYTERQNEKWQYTRRIKNKKRTRRNSTISMETEKRKMIL
jgi:hypothetical protein